MMMLHICSFSANIQSPILSTVPINNLLLANVHVNNLIPFNYIQ